MKKTYETIVKDSTKHYICGWCDAKLEMRTDRRRARIVADVERWTGNTGGIRTVIRYLDIDTARTILRQCRQARKLALTSNDNYQAYLGGYDTVYAVLSSMV